MRPKLTVIYVLCSNQDFKCIYCSDIINIDIAEVEHFNPYSYVKHSTKFYASCRLCNSIKYNKIFESLEEAREYIKKYRSEKVPKSRVPKRIYSKAPAPKILQRQMPMAKLGKVSPKKEPIKIEAPYHKGVFNSASEAIEYYKRLESLKLIL